MAYTRLSVANFGAAYAGLATAGLTIKASDRTTVLTARTTTGIAELQAGTGSYGAEPSLPDATQVLLVWDTGGSTPVYAFEEVRPGATASDIATAVWASGARTLTSFGTLAADAAVAVWAATTRTLSAFGFTVNTNANATETAIKAKTDNLPSDPASTSVVATAFAAVPAAVWGNGTRTLSAFAFSVTVGTNNDKTGYSLSTTPPTAADIGTAVWASAVRTLTTLNGLTPTSTFFTNAPSGGGSSITAADVWAYSSRTLTDDTGTAATRFLTMIALNAGAYRLTAPALALAPIGSGGGGGTAQEFWEYPYRSLTGYTLQGQTPNTYSAGQITLLRGDSVYFDIENLPDLSGASEVWVTGKSNYAETDANAAFQVTKTGGLIVAGGAPATSSALASITFPNATTARVSFKPAAAALLSQGGNSVNLYCDLQYRDGTEDHTPVFYRVRITPDVTNAV